MAISIECEKSNLRGKVLPLLMGKVFHVTSFKSYYVILRDGMIKTNKERDFKFTFPQSEISYGRKRGYVCLFDLREKSNDIIEEALGRFYFLNPPYSQNKPVFLIISPRLYSSLVLINDAKAKEEIGYKEMYIPDVECWYPGSISLEYVEEILEVTVI